jgi:LysM repeat protein
MKLNLTLFLLTFALGAEEFLEYKVVKGDTLSKVCKNYLSDPKKWRDLLQYNSIASPNLISPGMILKIPDGLRKKIVSTPIVPIAKLQNKSGLIRLKKPDFEEWFDGIIDKELYQDDLLRTGEDSTAEILFKAEPQATIFLEEKSIMKIRKDEIKSIELKLGTLLFKSANTQNNKTILNVKTNSAE